MVTLEYAEKVAQVVEQPEVNPGVHPAEAGPWFYRMPAAGVKYFSYEYLPSPDLGDEPMARTAPEANVR